MKTLRLTSFYIRTSWSIRTLVFLFAMFFLTAFILWGLPHIEADAVPLLYRSVSLSIVDEDRSMISQLLIEELSTIDMIENVYLDTLPQARRRLSEAETVLIIVIPSGFFEQTAYSMERSPLLVYRSSQMPSETMVLTRLFDHLAEGITAVQSAFFAYRELARPLYDEDQLYFRSLDAAFLRLFFKMLGRKAFTGVAGVDYLQTGPFFASAMICLLTLLTALLSLLQVQQDRRSYLQIRLQASGVGWFRCFLARQLAGLPWLAAGFAPLLAGLSVLIPHFNLIWTSLAILLLYWVTAAWFQAWGLIGSCGDEKLLGAWLALLLILVLGGCIYPAALLPVYLQRFLPLSPAWFAGDMIYSAARGRQAALPWLGWLLHLAIATAGVYWAAGGSRRRTVDTEGVYLP